MTLGIAAEELCWKTLTASRSPSWPFDPSMWADQISDILSEIIGPEKTSSSHLEEKLAYKASKLITDIISYYLPDDIWQIKGVDEKKGVVFISDEYGNVLIEINTFGDVKVSPLKEGQTSPCNESYPWIEKRDVLHCYDYCGTFQKHEAFERRAFEVKQALKDLL